MSSTEATANRFQSWAENVPLHPFLFGAHAVLSLYALNADRLPIGDTLPLIAGVLVIAAVLLALIRWLTGDIVKAGILTTILVVAVVQYRGLLHIVTKSLGLPMLDRPFPVIWLVAVAGCLWVFGRSRNKLGPLGLGLNITGIATLGFVSYSIAGFLLSETASAPAAAVQQMNRPPAVVRQASEPRRDVYYLIFDRYANSDTLRDVYGFDNTPFLRQLQDMGFYVATDSVANYQRTAHSVASSLNIDYLDRLTELLGSKSSSWLPLYGMLQDHVVGRFFKQQGYEFIQVGSWWNPTRDNPLADRNINRHATPELQRVFLSQTAFGQIAGRIGLTLFDDRSHQCERIRAEFTELAELAREPQPKFVFAHLLVPHPPFVFGPDGECLSLETVTNRSRTENYINQVRYANTEIIEMIRAIRANSKTDPIIILQADEGPWPAPYAGDERFLGTDVSSVDWRRASRQELREKMRILNALYLPGPGSSPLHASMTPVNTFRIVFNRYFGTDLPLLPDQNYIFLSNRQLYAFQPVTELVR